MEARSSQAKQVVVIGGGIVGLASAWQLQSAAPDLQITVVEKESDLAQHQTGRNSGVIHSGIYYRPGSLRALHCRAGKQMLEDFCDQYEVARKKTGKVIVAVDRSELPALANILERGKANGVHCEEIDQDKLAEYEPHVRGIAALHVPESGIVDYPGVCRALAAQITARGGRIRTSFAVSAIEHRSDRVRVASKGDSIEADFVVNCGGLHSDRLARLNGQELQEKIVPFRGEYYELVPSAEHLCNGLIYPVPDPRFPFLGVHFTRMIGGGVECGPNAVLALAREGYRWTDISLGDLAESLTYPGFLRLAARCWTTGLGEIYRSLFKSAFVKALQRLIPDIRSQHLTAAPSGVRAQALTRQGTLVDDFLLLHADRTVNVCNAPSPAATASLKIGETVAERVLHAMS